MWLDTLGLQHARMPAPANRGKGTTTPRDSNVSSLNWAGIRRARLLYLGLLGLGLSLGAQSAAKSPLGAFQHGVSTVGRFMHGPDFEHFEFVNPDAPKGGELVLSLGRSFDNFTPLIAKGIAPPGLGVINNAFLYDGLFQINDDEVGTFYGRLAQWVAIAPDFSAATIRLHPDARWHDGAAITARDVKFTFEHIAAHSVPGVKLAFRFIQDMEIRDEKEIHFRFDRRFGVNAASIISLGKVPIIPEHFWRGRDMSRATRTPPLGSGPYRIGDYQLGRFLVYQRVTDYWGRKLAINRGRYNFDRIRYEYYRDANVAREALLKGMVDFRTEGSARQWAKSYDVAARERGDLVLEEHSYQRYVGLQAAIAWNTRRKKLADVRVREALALALDFEWQNRVQFHGAYRRGLSYFGDTELAQRGTPSEAELALLAPFRDQLPPALFTEPFSLPVSSARGQIRARLKQADALLAAAGWVIRDRERVHVDSGEPLELEFIAYPGQETLLMPYVAQLRRLGIDAHIRIVEAAQFQNHMRTLDFDATVHSYPIAMPPNREIPAYFSSATADNGLSANRPGIKHPAVDMLVVRIMNATAYDDLVASSRALDRVLLWNHYLVPLWAMGTSRVVYWNKFGRPHRDARYRTAFPETWWYDVEKAAAVEAAK